MATVSVCARARVWEGGGGGWLRLRLRLRRAGCGLGLGLGLAGAGPELALARSDRLVAVLCGPLPTSCENFFKVLINRFQSSTLRDAAFSISAAGYVAGSGPIARFTLCHAVRYCKAKAYSTVSTINQLHSFIMTK